MSSAKNVARWSQGRVWRAWQRGLARLRLALLGAIAIIWSAWATAGLYVDWRWFDSLGYLEVYRKQVLCQTVLFLLGGLVFGLLYLANLRLARRLGGATAGPDSSEEGLWTYLARVSAGLSRDEGRGRRTERALLALGAVLALAFGLAAASA